MKPTAWVSGNLVSFEEASLDSGGWPQGTGIFETIKTVDGQPWALSRHMRRALNTARLNTQPFPNEEVIRRAVSETIASNPYAIGRLRLLFGISGNLIVTHQEYFEIEEPATLGVHKLDHEVSGNTEKKFPYTANLQILKDAKAAGFDDFMLINRHELITETAIANLVFEVDGEWITPPISDGVLPGVMRALLIEKNGVIVRQISSNQIAEIQSGFVVSSLKIAQPISRIGDRFLTISSESEQMRREFAATALATSVG